MCSKSGWNCSMREVPADLTGWVFPTGFNSRFRPRRWLPAGARAGDRRGMPPPFMTDIPVTGFSPDGPFLIGQRERLTLTDAGTGGERGFPMRRRVTGRFDAWGRLIPVGAPAGNGMRSTMDWENPRTYQSVASQ